MGRTDLFIVLTIIILVSAIFLGNMGFTTITGVPVDSGVTGAPSFIAYEAYIGSWIDDLGTFFVDLGIFFANLGIALAWFVSLLAVVFLMATFMVAGMPAWLSAIFLFMDLAWGWLLFGMIRGNH